MNASATKRSYCRYCLSFCGIKIDFDADDVPIRVLGDPDHPVSKGYTCNKGRSLLKFYSSGRLLHPMRFGSTNLNWDQALGELSQTIRNAVSSHGPDAVALYAGTNATLDATGMWTALGFMYRLQSNNIYTVASVDAINKQVVGENMTSGASAGLIPQIDFDLTDCLLLVGANPIVSHGHLAGMPYPGKRLHDIIQRGGTVITVDPRITRTSRKASLHARPLPGTDYAWLAFVINQLLSEPAGNGVNLEYLARHASGLTELRTAVCIFDEARTQRITGLSAQCLHALVTAIRSAKYFSAVTGTGVSFSNAGIVSEWFLYALLAIKGSLDQPGGIWFNPGLAVPAALPGAPARTAWQTVWSTCMPARPDLPAKTAERPCAGLADEILANHIKVLICVGGNPLNAFPDSTKTREALAKLDALVVLDTHKNDLVDLAHYGLPVCGQLERADSSIYAQNSAPVMSVLFTERILPPPGEARPAWWFFSSLGEMLGLDTVKLGKPTAQLDELEVLKTIKGARELFDRTSLQTDGFVIRPEKAIGWVIESVLPGQKWRLHSPVLAAELQRVLSQAETPVMSPAFYLVAMREDDHLNTQFMQAARQDVLPKAWISGIDAGALGLSGGQTIRLRSAYGTMLALAAISDQARPGTVCVPHGYPALGNVSLLTSGMHAINPLSGMVTQTALPVSIVKILPASPETQP